MIKFIRFLLSWLYFMLFIVFIYIQSANLILDGIAGVLFLDIAEAICDGDAELAGFVLREHIRQHIVHPDACLVTVAVEHIGCTQGNTQSVIEERFLQ